MGMVKNSKQYPNLQNIVSLNEMAVLMCVPFFRSPRYGEKGFQKP